MFAKLFALFILIPLVELYLLIKVGSYLGALQTILLVVLTAAAGAFFTKLEGLRTLRRMQVQLMYGQIPAEELVDSVLICIAGLMLLTPGFLTDALGLWILIPVTRRSVKSWLRRRVDQFIHRRVNDRYPI